MRDYSKSVLSFEPTTCFHIYPKWNFCVKLFQEIAIHCYTTNTVEFNYKRVNITQLRQKTISHGIINQSGINVTTD